MIPFCLKFRKLTNNQFKFIALEKTPFNKISSINYYNPDYYKRGKICR